MEEESEDQQNKKQRTDTQTPVEELESEPELEPEEELLDLEPAMLMALHNLQAERLATAEKTGAGAVAESEIGTLVETVYGVATKQHALGEDLVAEGINDVLKAAKCSGTAFFGYMKKGSDEQKTILILKAEPETLRVLKLDQPKLG